MKPLDAALIERIASEYGTPVYAYDVDVVRERVASLQNFDGIRYAQKANSNTHLLRLLRDLDLCVDAVSHGELRRALRAGYEAGGDPSPLVYTADVVNEETLDLLVEQDIPMNAGSVDMLSQLGRRRRGHRVWLRVNPGFGHGHSRKTNTGGESSKHGIWHDGLDEALKRIDEYALDLVGLHMHIGSGADFEHLRQVADAMVVQVQSLGRDIRAISCGGGLPVPYRAGESGIDIDAYYQVWDSARTRIAESVGHPVHLEIEPGRYLVAECGTLVGEVLATKMMGRNRFVVIDAGFNDLVRPVMYGSFHEISIVKRGGQRVEGPLQPTLVAGPLCESGDVFTQEEGGVVVPRELPPAEVGDWVVIHDAGAYASSMASNYNSRGLAPEVLVESGEPRLVRRRQTIDDLLALEEL